MLEFAKTLAGTPIPTLLVIFGAIFIFLAIGGKLGAQIITDNVRRSLAATAGVIFVVAGIALYSVPYFNKQDPAMSKKQNEVSSNSIQLRGESNELGPIMKTTWIVTFPVLNFITAEGKTIEGEFNKMIEKKVLLTEVLKKSHGRPVIIKEQVVSDEVIYYKHENNETNKVSVEHGKLHNCTLLIELKDGKWTKKLLEKEPTAEQLNELNLLTYSEEQEQYPDHPVHVGESWELNGPQIALFQGLANARSVSGKAYLRLEEIQDHSGVQCALISQRSEVQMTTIFGEFEMNMSGGVYGSTLRSLKDFVDLKYQFSGQIKMDFKKLTNTSETISFQGPAEIEMTRELIQ